MAKNRSQEFAKEILLPVPAGTKSGDPLVVGALPCVAMIDRNADGEASVDCGGSYWFEVEGKNKAGNTAIAAGAIVYLKEGKISANNEEGARFGYAQEPVASGAKTLVRVKVGY